MEVKVDLVLEQLQLMHNKLFSIESKLEMLRRVQEQIKYGLERIESQLEQAEAGLDNLEEQVDKSFREFKMEVLGLTQQQVSPETEQPKLKKAIF